MCGGDSGCGVVIVCVWCFVFFLRGGLDPLDFSHCEPCQGVSFGPCQDDRNNCRPFAHADNATRAARAGSDAGDARTRACILPYLRWSLRPQCPAPEDMEDMHGSGTNSGLQADCKHPISSISMGTSYPGVQGTIHQPVQVGWGGRGSLVARSTHPGTTSPGEEVSSPTVVVASAARPHQPAQRQNEKEQASVLHACVDTDRRLCGLSAGVFADQRLCVVAPTLRGSPKGSQSTEGRVSNAVPK